MSDTEAALCPDCGKKTQEKRGSITQWIGLGDFCNCKQQDAAATASFRSQRQKQCKRCLKPIGSNQSMTQWLIRKETCKCGDETTSTVLTDYTQKAMSARSRRRAPRESENKTLVVCLAIGVMLFAAASGYAILDVLGMSRTLRLYAGRLKGNERTMLLSHDSLELATVHPPTTENEWKTHAFSYADQVFIRDSTISDDEIEQLASNIHLVRLILKNCDGFTAKGVNALQKCDSLTHISLDGSSLDSEILKALGKLSIASLDLSNTKIGKADWSALLENDRLLLITVTGTPTSHENKRVFSSHGFNTEGDYFRRSVTSKQASD